MEISEIELKMLAKEASKKFLDKGTSLNESISKIAEERKMNPHQLARVCEAANLDTYNAMWDREKTGSFTFDLADQEKIAADLSGSKSLLLDEYNNDFQSIKDLLPSDKQIETSKHAEKTAAANFLKESSKQEVEVSTTKIRKLMSKLAQSIEELNSASFELDIMRKEAELRIKDIIKTAALRGENIQMAYLAAIATYPEKIASTRELFSRILTELQPHGIDFTKRAEIMNEDAEGNRSPKVVNKQHAMLRHLDTINRCEDELAPIKNAKDYFVKKIEILKSLITTKKWDNEDH